MIEQSEHVEQPREAPARRPVLDQVPEAVRTLVLAHASARVIAYIEAGHLGAGQVAALIRDVLPDHHPSSCRKCQEVTPCR